jgi:DNA-directed RNA polymerase subunit RPC12/RpoP
MRCQDCAKFVSFDEPEVELQTEEMTVDYEGGDDLKFSAEAEARVVLKCAECSTELKETTFNLEGEFLHSCTKLPADILTQSEEEGITPEDVEFDASAFDRMQDKDRRGNPIRNHRYMKHMYGADVTATCKCPYCKEQIEINMRDEMQSSGFDEL